jgi:hypothetical protein
MLLTRDVDIVSGIQRTNVVAVVETRKKMVKMAKVTVAK